MNILVTVGTTPFDSLIRAADEHISNEENAVICQIASGRYTPRNHSFFTHSETFQEFVAQADLVITHGGAATIFELLEQGKKIVVVPNLVRIDKHQLELARYIEANNYGVVCDDLNKLSEKAVECWASSYSTFESKPFFMQSEILNYFEIS